MDGVVVGGIKVSAAGNRSLSEAPARKRAQDAAAIYPLTIFSSLRENAAICISRRICTFFRAHPVSNGEHGNGRMDA